MNETPRSGQIQLHRGQRRGPARCRPDLRIVAILENTPRCMTILSSIVTRAPRPPLGPPGPSFRPPPSARHRVAVNRHPCADPASSSRGYSPPAPKVPSQPTPARDTGATPPARGGSRNEYGGGRVRCVRSYRSGLRVASKKASDQKSSGNSSSHSLRGLFLRLVGFGFPDLEGSPAAIKECFVCEINLLRSLAGSHQTPRFIDRGRKGTDRGNRTLATS